MKNTLSDSSSYCYRRCSTCECLLQGVPVSCKLMQPQAELLRMSIPCCQQILCFTSLRSSMHSFNATEKSHTGLQSARYRTAQH